MRALRLIAVCLLLAPALAPGAQAQADPGAPQLSIVDVRVEGNRRLSSAAFFRLTTLRSGQPYDTVGLRRQFRALWDSGMFDDLWVEVLDAAGGKVVVFHVIERPVVVSVDFGKSPVVSNTGIDERLRERDLSVNLNEPLDRERVRAVEEEIKRLHEEKGFLGTEVRAEVTASGETGQSVVFRIKPGAKTLIKKIEFTGNTVFKDGALKDLMSNTIETGLKGLVSKKDLYHPIRFQQDLESIRTAYQARGHLDVLIKPPVVEFTGKASRPPKSAKKAQRVAETPKPPPPNESPKQRDRRLRRQAAKLAKQEARAAKKLPPKRKAHITVPLEEGPQYTVGEVTVSGNTIFEGDVLRSLVPVRTGTTFNADALGRGLDAIEGLYGQQGYFYATTNRQIKRRENNVADVEVVVNEGQQYRLRSVEFAGNTSTKDRVLRRELSMAEGDVFNSRLWQIGLTRINQLGYWALSREPEIVPVPGQPLLDARITGTEQGRNEVQVGGGFSGVEGAFFQGTYSTRNFLGRGEILSAAIQVGGRSQSINISFTEPFFLGTRNTIGGSVFQQRIEFTDFTRESTGFSLLFGQRLGNFSSWALRYRNDRFDEFGGAVFFFNAALLPEGFEDIDAGALFNGEFGTPIPQGVKTTNSTLVPVFSYNTVNNPFKPSKGLRLRLSMELTGNFLGGDNEFIKPILAATWYRPLFRRAYFAINSEGGFVEGINDKLVPRSERFFLGGDLRGPRVFETRSLAPVGPVSGIAPLADNEGNILGIPFAIVGGESYFLSQAELVLQLSDPFDIALFLDAGNAFDEITGFDLGELRYSAGIEGRFYLPIFQAPLRLIWGQVLDEEPGDRINSFQFSIGFPF